MPLRFAVSIMLLLFATRAAGSDVPVQGTNRAALASLNRDVWRPFVSGIAQDEARLYVGVHSADFYWVAPGTKGRIMDHSEYEDDSIGVMARRKEKGEKVELEFRFLERNVRADFASEKVIVRVVTHHPEKGPITSYGISQYFSRRESTGWKMLLQFGSTEKGTAEIFESAARIDDLDRFERPLR